MPKSSLVAVALVDAIPEGKFIKVVIAQQSIILAKVAGQVYAVEDNCSHEDYPLSLGCLEGDRIKCSLHGSRFSLATGQPQEDPADEPIRTYPVDIADGQVWLDLTHRSD